MAKKGLFSLFVGVGVLFRGHGVKLNIPKKSFRKNTHAKKVNFFLKISAEIYLVIIYLTISSVRLLKAQAQKPARPITVLIKLTTKLYVLV